MPPLVRPAPAASPCRLSASAAATGIRGSGPSPAYGWIRDVRTAPYAGRAEAHRAAGNAGPEDASDRAVGSAGRSAGVRGGGGTGDLAPHPRIPGAPRYVIPDGEEADHQRACVLRARRGARA